MSSELSRRFDASSLTDGERFVLAERHPELAGHNMAVAWGSPDEKIIRLIDALAGAFAADAKGGLGRFDVAVLSEGERQLLSERHPSLGGHKVDMVCTTSDPAIARVLDAVLGLFGDDEAHSNGAAALKVAPKDVAPKEVTRKETKEAAHKPLVAVLPEADSALSEAELADRASWALPDNGHRDQ